MSGRRFSTKIVFMCARDMLAPPHREVEKTLLRDAAGRLADCCGSNPEAG